jgi:hypothetical protein
MNLNIKNPCKSMRLPAILVIALSFIVNIVSATQYVTQANIITFTNPLGLMIPLGIENWVPAADAVMYYNYIAVGLILLIAGFAGQTNESRFTFFVPVFAGLMVFVGWLHAPDPASYFGMIIACMLLGAMMYMNDMNHEKFGLPGPGTKLLTIVMLIIVFEASVTLMSTSGFNIFPELGNTGQSQQSLTCGDQQTGGYGYTCDASGKIMLGASVASVNGVGGGDLSVASIGMWAIQVMIGIIQFIIKVVAGVLLFSAVLVAAYPALAASPQAMLILGVMQLVIWAIYIVTFYNWYAKPSFETAQV